MSMVRCLRGRDAVRVEHGSTLQRQGREAGILPASFLLDGAIAEGQVVRAGAELQRAAGGERCAFFQGAQLGRLLLVVGGNEADRKSTRLNSSHSQISYAVFCLK